MRIVTSVTAMQRLARRWKRLGTMVGLVPTMGCLHEGHVSLIRTARKQAGERGRVVVSIYVNPTQFGPAEDLAKYPRDLPGDKKLCRKAGVDLLFTPGDKDIYPRKGLVRLKDRTPQRAVSTDFSTYVVEESLSRGMEGASRPAHFRGVTTVVAKLFNIVQPDVAVFGQKDFQQAAIIQRMAADLNFPVRIVVAPTVREPDGLALSTRNKYLSPRQRRHAVALWQAIQQARQAVRTSKRPVPAGRLKSELKWLIETRPSMRVDYIEFFDPETFQSVAEVQRGVHMALAVFVGKTRLIDNATLRSAK
jgi:pantoate--beta-alanine ligase